MRLTKNKRKLKRFAEAFDTEIISAVEDTLGKRFDELDSSLFGVDDVLDVLTYDGEAVVIMSGGKIYSIKEFNNG